MPRPAYSISYVLVILAIAWKGGYIPGLVSSGIAAAAAQAGCYEVVGCYLPS